MKHKLFSVIIAGGKGTRFWPLSRSLRPKQLLTLFGTRSLVHQTVQRVRSFGGADQTLVVTIAEQLGALRRELRDLPRRNFLAEPEGKNTAPCIGLAALEVVNRDPDAVMIILPADHWVADVAAFRSTLRSAAMLAAQTDRLVTIGIPPAYPESGYGYIVKGKVLNEIANGKAHSVKKFKEKPSLQVARQLIRQGSLWNAGIFAWKATTLLRLLERYQPLIYEPLSRIAKIAGGKSLSRPSVRLRAAVAREYDRMPAVSIDYGIVEKAAAEGKVATVQADFGWSDVGSWAAVHRLSPRNTDGNAGNGRWLAVGATNCFIQAADRLVVLLGVHETVVVDTPDALLVGDLKRSQDVRELVNELKRSGYGSYTVR